MKGSDKKFIRISLVEKTDDPSKPSSDRSGTFFPAMEVEVQGPVHQWLDCTVKDVLANEPSSSIVDLQLDSGQLASLGGGTTLVVGSVQENAGGLRGSHEHFISWKLLRSTEAVNFPNSLSINEICTSKCCDLSSSPSNIVFSFPSPLLPVVTRCSWEQSPDDDLIDPIDGYSDGVLLALITTSGLVYTVNLKTQHPGDASGGNNRPELGENSSRVSTSNSILASLSAESIHSIYLPPQLLSAIDLCVSSLSCSLDHVCIGGKNGAALLVPLQALSTPAEFHLPARVPPYTQPQRQVASPQTSQISRRAALAKSQVIVLKAGEGAVGRLWSLVGGRSTAEIGPVQASTVWESDLLGDMAVTAHPSGVVRVWETEKRGRLATHVRCSWDEAMKAAARGVDGKFTGMHQTRCSFCAQFALVVLLSQPGVRRGHTSMDDSSNLSGRCS